MTHLHPIVSAVYYIVILTLTMITYNPVCVFISIIGAVISIIMNKGWERTWKGILMFSPVIIITAVINPLFSHEGITIIGYFSNGNPITSESIWYGVGMAGVLAAVLLWFLSINTIITSEKIMYLLGRIIPSLALILSLVLRMVPRFSEHLKQVYAVNKCTQRSSSNTYFHKLKVSLSALSSSVTWILDDSVHTAESMKCRGYGLPGRTVYSRYYFCKYDTIWLLIVIILFLYILYGRISGHLYWQYYPYVTGEINGVHTISIFMAYTILCIAPSCIMKEGRVYDN